MHRHATGDLLVRVAAPLGLIAGEGIFPLLVARGARAAGRKVICAALAGSAWPQLRDECDSFRWVGERAMDGDNSWQMQIEFFARRVSRN